MSQDEAQIRALIHRWAAAVQAGDLAGVLTGHTEDVVMFDVPPPQNGVRGIDDYRATWPPFFTWLAGGAVFEILDLEVTAGTDVAFAHALLRCATPDDLAAAPDRRLRLTLGLRKDEREWAIAHEHHSYPDTSVVVPSVADEDANR
ncbi:SgcJ/EcaC family oxidoreductase [Nocardia sp. NPDC048505]|uniref:YybH family protein n=1 Tax=unclassified Nocardia TaxID=2637762 RepID=UPI0033CFC2FA